MKNSLVKVNAVSVRNQNNVRRMHGTVDRILDMPGVMRVICGRCDEGALSMLEHTARRENELAGMDMAVGCIVSDKPLSEVEIARSSRAQIEHNGSVLVPSAAVVSLQKRRAYHIKPPFQLAVVFRVGLHRVDFRELHRRFVQKLDNRVSVIRAQINVNLLRADFKQVKLLLGGCFNLGEIIELSA